MDKILFPNFRGIYNVLYGDPVEVRPLCNNCYYNREGYGCLEDPLTSGTICVFIDQCMQTLNRSRDPLHSEQVENYRTDSVYILIPLVKDFLCVPKMDHLVCASCPLIDKI